MATLAMSKLTVSMYIYMYICVLPQTHFPFTQIFEGISKILL
uniref:Uncharacterized protein n=1 Tax=Anguilla anguilla TaxID=7936 RepID=A0A0E9XRV8_ANGAN